jgi:aminopeptidase N
MYNKNPCNSKLLTIVFLLVLITLSCDTRKKSVTPTKRVILDTIHIKKIPKTSIYKHTNTVLFTIPKTTLFVNFDWMAHELIGTAIMEITPFANNKIDTIQLDAKSMEIYTVWQGNNTCQFFANKDYLYIYLPNTLSGNQTSKLTIKYKAKPDSKKVGGSQAIRNDKGLYFTNTDKKDKYKPTQLFTQGETESNSCWFPTIDKPNNKSIFTLHITVPDSFTSLSNGNLIAQKDSATYRIDTWKNEKPMSAYLVMMCIGKYSLQKDFLKTLPVNYYVEPFYEKNAQNIFARTPEMIDYFSNILGVPYPWEKYSQITARDYVSGAMENTSASLFGDFVQKTERELLDNGNDGIVSHELFHQWFGDLVTCESWSHLTLNEGFATFGEHLWLEKAYSNEEQERLKYNDLRAYLKFAELFDTPLINFYYGDKEDMFNSITYKKGGRVLNLLRSELGADIFFKGIQNYLQNNAYGTVEVDDLRIAMEKVSGKDLRYFFNQWFLKGGHPNLEFSYSRPDSNTLQISYIQKNDSAHYIFDLPFQFKCMHEGKSVVQNFRINKLEGELLMDIADLNLIDLKTLPIIIADANHTLVGSFTEQKSVVAHKKVFTSTNSYINKMRALNAVYKAGASATAEEIFYASLQDPLKYIREAGLQSINMTTISNKEKLKSYLFNIANTDNYKPNIAKAISHLSHYKDTLHKDLFLQKCTDSSYAVASSALLALATLDSIGALETAESLMVNTSVRSSLKTAIANLFAHTGDLKYLTFFENAIPTSFGGERNSIINNFYIWSIKNNTNESFKKVISLLEYYATWDEVDNIKINATTQLNNYIKYFETESADPKSIYKSNLIATIKLKLEAIYAQEKEESILKEYRKKTWIQ